MKSKGDSAQGSLEYLILAAAILLVATVAVALLTQSGATKTSVEYSYCQTAAKQCAFSLFLDPLYDCKACEKQCSDVTGRELFPGAVGCCKTGNSAAIYEGATKLC
ncbi:MAG: hypothetical protein QXO69_03460 [archaeon]